jgi:hypothetical protein
VDLIDFAWRWVGILKKQLGLGKAVGILESLLAKMRLGVTRPTTSSSPTLPIRRTFFHQLRQFHWFWMDDRYGYDLTYKKADLSNYGGWSYRAKRAAGST